ncbi:hypothetical protein F5884DRAFT_278495 [Xylogone sp. PMI_703]|nr:hypothetical protein F5884DRAFT_278495 [Xylogone sp. PMI_703]
MMTLPSAMSAATRNRIQDFSSLKYIGGVKSFVCRFAPHPAYSALATRILDQQYHPLQEKLLKRYTSRTDTLWWSCLSFKTVGKRVVRSWLARRLRICFIEALRREGFSRDGSRLNDQKPPLYGTAQLSPDISMVHLSNVELQKEADVAVKHIIRISNGARARTATKAFGERKGHVPRVKKPQDSSSKSWRSAR